MILAFFMITAAVAIHSQQKKHPAWKQPGDILFVVGTVLTLTGTLYQSYLISIRNGQHLTGTHATLGLIAIVLLACILIVWNRNKDKNKNQEQKYIWIVFLWAVTTILCLVPGSPECWNCMTGMSPHYVGLSTVTKTPQGHSCFILPDKKE